MDGNRDLENDTRPTTDKQEDNEKEETVGRKVEDKEMLGGEGDENPTTLKFTDLPDVPLRKILKLLRHQNRANLTLRMVSKSVKQIVDSHVELAWKFIPGKLSKSDMKHNILENSDRDIHLDLNNILDLRVLKDWNKDRYFHRIYSISGASHLIVNLMKMQEMPKLEKVRCIGIFSSDLTNTQLSQFSHVKHLVLTSCGERVIKVLLPACAQSLESLDIWDSFIQKESLVVTCDFPRLKFLKLSGVDMKPLLALLSTPRALEKVVLKNVDFTSINSVQYNVAPIKKLEHLKTLFVKVNAQALFEFLGKCSVRTEDIEIIRETIGPETAYSDYTFEMINMKVDHTHLLPDKFVIFKKEYCYLDWVG